MKNPLKPYCSVNLNDFYCLKSSGYRLIQAYKLPRNNLIMMVVGLELFKERRLAWIIEMISLESVVLSRLIPMNQ